MNIENGNHYVVRFRGGELWHFFSKPGRGIYYRCMGEDGRWGGDIELLRDVREDFSVYVDSNDVLHLIYQSIDGEIRYMKYSEKVWSTQVLSRYEPARYVIRFPAIIAVDNCMHILFVIGRAFNIGYWLLCHYYFNGSKWIDHKIARFTAGRLISPFHFDLYGKDIHLVYRALSSEGYQVFYCYFNDERGVWSTPENVTRSGTDCNTPSVLIMKNRLHLVWTSLQDSNLQVKYSHKLVDSYRRSSWKRETVLSTGGSNCSHPHLLWSDGKLVCMWCQNNELYSCISYDEGFTWERPRPCGWGDNDTCYYIGYFTGHPQENKVFKVRRIFARLDKGISVPVIGKHINISEKATLGCDTLAENTSNVRDLSFTSTGDDGKDEEIKAESKGQGSKAKQEGNLRAGHDYLELEERLSFWMKKIEEVHHQNQNIINQLAEIRKFLIDNQEKWNVFMGEFSKIKEEIDDICEKGIFRRIFHIVRR